MRDERPTPEAMLALARAEAAREGRGRLKLFFGAAPGVGKTYAMLEEARARQAAGIDVVLGWLETHGRPATAALAEGLERIPPRVVVHRGSELREFDLDAALARRPGLLLLDELPHTNAPGSRHARRWQDLDELLGAGIDVYTTLNVQHLESLADVVERVTGVAVRERVPDRLLDEADEVELVDLPPEELLARLEAGHVYKPDTIQRAREGYFRRANLLALRELALRRTAERVDKDVEAARREQGGAEVWPTRDRLMVAVGPAPQSVDLIRAAYRMASRLRAPWLAVSVEPVSRERAPEEARRVSAGLLLAERLGAETLVVRGDRVAEALLDVARARNVTRLVVGRPTHPAWRDRLRGSLLDTLMRGARGIDVLVTGDEAPAPREKLPPRSSPAPPWTEYALALGLVAAASTLGMLLRGVLDVVDHAMIHLLAVVLAASRASRAPAMIATLTAVAAFDVFFVPPFYTFRVSDLRFVTTFAVMAIVGLTVSALTLRIREAAEAARRREQRSAALYAISRAFAAETEVSAIARATAEHSEALVGGEAVVWLAAGESLTALAGAERGLARDAREIAVARWVLEHATPAGRGTDTLPSVSGLYLPIQGPRGVSGVLGTRPPGELDPEQRQLLDLFAAAAGFALERARLAEQAAAAAVSAEAERTRSSLLAGVSHDLRTPLASIVGGVTAVLDRGALEPSDRVLLETMRDEALRLGRLVHGLLELTRLESGAISPRVEWYPASELASAVLSRLPARLDGRRIALDIQPPELEVQGDGLLLGQLLENLLDNALKYSPPGSQVDLVARAEPGRVRLEVRDRGPGVPPGEERRIFERFYRADDGGRAPGAGLGLAICAAVVRLHGGQIRVEPRADGPGARFVVELPVTGSPPSPPQETP